MVEETRFVRNRLNVSTIDPRGKDLRWVYCHLFQFYSPPRDFWVVDETVSYFGTDAGSIQPLSSHRIFSSDEPRPEDGVHWRKPVP